MGNGTYYGIDGREYYISDGTVIEDSLGNKGKVITEIGDIDYHSSLPLWSKTTKIYFKRDDSHNHKIEQMRVFSNRKATMDFDWNHTHKNFQSGTVHVHDWYLNKNGKWQRSKNPRYNRNHAISHIRI